MSIASQIVKLADNKAAIKAAIKAKSPTVSPTDSLAQWPEAIASIPSGGGSAGNGLPLGCPRIDLVQLSDTYEEIYIVEDARAAPAGSTHNFNFWWKPDIACSAEYYEVEIANDGNVTQTQNGYTVSTSAGERPSRSLSLSGGKFNVVRLRLATAGATCIQLDADYGQESKLWRVAAKTNASVLVGPEAWGIVNQVSFLRYYYHKPLTNSVITGFFAYANGLGECTLDGNFNIQFYNDTFGSTLKLKTTFGDDSNFYGFNSVSAPEVDFSECDFSKVISFTNNYGFKFFCCPSIIMPPNPNKGLRISFSVVPSGNKSPSLTLESLLSILGSLYDHVGGATGQTPTLTIGATNLATLEASQEGQAALAAAQAKGWSVA